jgi:hypothetical protein
LFPLQRSYKLELHKVEINLDLDLESGKLRMRSLVSKKRDDANKSFNTKTRGDQDQDQGIYQAEYVDRLILPDQSADPLPSPLCFRFKGATKQTSERKTENAKPCKQKER